MPARINKSTTYKKGVPILECLDKSDPGSEGRFLSHMFDIMQIDSQYMEIRTKEQFLSNMRSNPFTTVHITTHGNLTLKEQFIGFWTPGGIVELKDLSKKSIEKKTIISTACKSGAKKFRGGIVDSLQASHYIAPNRSPSFKNSIFFVHMFYHYKFVLKLPIAKAVEKYREGYKNPSDFSLTSQKLR